MANAILAMLARLPNVGMAALSATKDCRRCRGSCFEARLMVRFNPAVVSAYRLVGHEANSVAQLMPPSTVVDLHPGDETPILFEILPQINPPTVPSWKVLGNLNRCESDWLAECELSWINPATGKKRW